MESEKEHSDCEAYNDIFDGIEDLHFDYAALWKIK